MLFTSSSLSAGSDLQGHDLGLEVEDVQGLPATTLMCSSQDLTVPWCEALCQQGPSCCQFSEFSLLSLIFTQYRIDQCHQASTPYFRDLFISKRHHLVKYSCCHACQ